jgi:hypothetical protein
LTQTRPIPALRAALTKIASVDPLVLDGETLGDAALPAYLHDLFATSPLVVSSAGRSIPESSDDSSLTITGRLTIGPLSDIAATLLFFESRYGLGEGTAQLELLLTFDERLPSLTIDRFGPPQTYPDLVSADLAARRRAAFLQAIQLHDTGIAISSYDFTLAARSADQAAFAISCTLPSSPAREKLVNGINFDVGGVALQADIMTDFLQTGASGPIWDEITKLATGKFAVRGAITLDIATGERILSLSHALDPIPTVDLGVGDLRVAMQALTIRAGLDAETRTAASFGATLTLAEASEADHPELTLAVELPMGAGLMRVEGVFGDGIGIAALERLLPVDDGQGGKSGAGQHIPAELQPAHDLAITRFSALASLPPAVAAIEVEIEAPRPWSIIDPIVKVTPSAVLSARLGGGAAAVDVRLEADWTITDEATGETTEFDVYADPLTGLLGIAMKTGEVLTPGATMRLIGLNPPSGLDAIALVDFDIEGNYKDKSFSFQLDAASTHEIPVFADETLTISDLSFSGERTGDGTEWTIEAILNIGDTRADIVIADDDQGLSFDAVLTRVEIGAMAKTILCEVPLPPGLEAFTLGNARLHYDPKLVRFIANDSTVVELIDGFGFSVDHLSLTREAGGAGTDIRIDLALELDEGSEAPTAILTGEYQSIAPAAASGATGRWSFNVNTDGGAAINLSKLIERFEDLVGLSFPFPHSDLELDTLECRMVFEGDQHSFAIGGALARITDDHVRDEYGRMLCVALKSATGDWTHFLVVEAEPDVGFGDLPVVGPRLPDPSLTLHSVIFTLASAGLNAEQAAALIAAVPSGALSEDLVPKTPDVLEKGNGMVVQVAGPTGLLSFPPSLSPTSTPQPAALPGTASQQLPPAPLTAGTTLWKPVGLALGPIELDRLGMQFDSGTLTLMCDARMMLGPVTIGFVGLGLKSPITSFSPSGVLTGLSIDYRSGPVEVGGGLLRTPDGQFQGQLHLTTAALSLDLIAGYSADPESFFAYGMMRDPPLGGSPEFFVEGIAVGMGYNSRLAVPTDVSGVASFPLVQAAMPPDPLSIGTGASDPADGIAGLRAVATVETGAGWLAGGVKFNSFKLIDSFVLIGIDFGRDTRITVMGLSRATLPPEAEEPVALFEVELLAQFDPARGTLKVDGLLTPRSFVLSRDAQMTGGFAFYSWFKDADGASAGDFVYSMGGYHPQFRPPAHYPNPARLMLNWQVSGDLSVKGSNYFAMTPACLMAGTSMEANWSSGDLSAWFDADADFLLYWRPFRYLAHIDTSIGVSYRLNLLFTSVTITVHVGVGIDVHGPPFGGSAYIDLDVVSFTVSFGDSGADAAFLDWDTFRGNFLPADPTNVSTIQPLQGLLRDRKDVPVATPRWLLRPDDLLLGINLSAPAKTVRLGTDLPAAAGALNGVSWNMGMGIAPMGVPSDDYMSDVTVVLRRQGRDQPDGHTAKWNECDDMAAIAQPRAAPASIWGIAGDVRPGDPNAPRLIDDALCTLQLVPVPHPPDMTGAIDLAQLRYDAENERSLDLAAPPPSDGYAQPLATGRTQDVSAADPDAPPWQDFMLQTLAGANQRRADIIDALVKRDIIPAEFGDSQAVMLDGFVRTPLDAWPAIRKLDEA